MCSADQSPNQPTMHHSAIHCSAIADSTSHKSEGLVFFNVFVDTGFLSLENTNASATIDVSTFNLDSDWPSEPTARLEPHQRDYLADVCSSPRERNGGKTLPCCPNCGVDHQTKRKNTIWAPTERCVDRIFHVAEVCERVCVCECVSVYARWCIGM